MLSLWESASAARWNPERGWHDPVIGAMADEGWLVETEMADHG